MLRRGVCDVVPAPNFVLLAAAFRGQSGPGVHGCHPRRLPVGLSVSTNHEAASGGVQVEILLAGKTDKKKKNEDLIFSFFFFNPPEQTRSNQNLMSPLVVSPQIIILWNSEKPPPTRNKWPPMPVPLIVTDGRRKVSRAASLLLQRRVTA